VVTNLRAGVGKALPLTSPWQQPKNPALTFAAEHPTS